jgi:predicted nuclease of predicted toxin-antitoxin system
MSIASAAKNWRSVAMKLLIDNNLSPALASGLRGAGFDTVHLRDILPVTIDDAAIADWARSHDRVIVAIDTDFGEILALSNSAKPSYVLIRQSRRSTEHLLSALTANLPHLATDLTAGCIAVFMDARIRIRKLPMSGRES